MSKTASLPFGKWLMPTAVILVFSLLRFYHLGEWSLWEDEETTIYFSQHLDQWFSKYSPVYFYPLNFIYQITGISIWWGRAFSTFCGLMTIWLFYGGFRKYTTSPVALMAAALLAVNFGHIFWSQSIRYYTASLLFNTLSAVFFVRGFKEEKPICVAASAFFWVCSMMCHFSSILLGPVFVGYLLMAMVFFRKSIVINKKCITAFLLSFSIAAIIFGIQVMQVRGYQLGIDPPMNKDPLHILITVFAYFGLPVMGIGTLSLIFAKKIPVHHRLFFGLLAIVPVLELLVIAKLGLVNVVTWYYGLMALIGFCFLTGFGLHEFLETRYKKAAGTLVILVFGYYAVFSFGYFTSMHGDRPSWKEGAHYLMSETGSDLLTRSDLKIYATVTGVVEFYLGVPPDETMTKTVVHPIPASPPLISRGIDQWFLVKASHVDDTYSEWFKNNCELRAVFPARTGPRDRSVLVYQRASTK